jgi:maltooligosyltrehalose trehalohydrolase
MSEGRLRIAAALLLTSPFTPMLFQGEEWGTTAPFRYFTDHDPALGEAVSEGRRGEFAAFGWDPDELPDPQAATTFEASKLAWDELDRSVHVGLLEWHRELLALRRRTHALSDPRLSRVGVETDEASATLTLTRGTVKVLVNLGEGDHCFALRGETTILAASDPAVRLSGQTVTVPADAAVIIETPDD